MSEIEKILKLTKNNSVQQKRDEILLQPFTYISQIPDPAIEIKFIRVFNHWLNIPTEKLHLISEALTMLHTSSLLIDDIEDNSVLRRGKPVAHSIYGIGGTINAAAYVTFIVLGKIQLLNHPKAIKVYTEQVLELHRGQGIDIYWRDVFKCPTEFEYKLMVVQKTGGLFMLSIRLMQLFSENKKDFSRFIVTLALYFQIRDDYCNLSMEEADNKGFYEDLTEGKFSFPIIHAIQKRKSQDVLRILILRTDDIETKKYCISLLEELGSLKYTRDVLESLDKEVREEAAKLGPNPLMDEVFDNLLSWKKIT